MLQSRLGQTMSHPRAGALIFFAALARTAVLFVVDPDEFGHAVASAGPSPRIELPPLPYSRIVVEFEGDVMLQLQQPDGENDNDLVLFLINEVERGEHWQVCCLLRKVDESDSENILDSRFWTYLYSVHRDGTVVDLDVTKPISEEDLATVQDENDMLDLLDDRLELRSINDLQRAEAARRLPIEFAHLVNARGVSVTHIDVPRQQRRAFTRKGLVHPQLYFVYIGDGTAEIERGKSDREYHVRWLVRGHWRHFSSGDRTWVRPYIKGPAGAPWKGRPIYVAVADEQPR
jgi:hypothetical protein